MAEAAGFRPGSPQDPREPEAAAADAELLAKGAFVTAGITTPDMLASETGLSHSLSPLGGGHGATGDASAGLAGGGGEEGWEAAAAEEERRTVLHGTPLAAVAEKPHPGSGSSRIGARPGATRLADPTTEAELAAAGLPGA
ncbi:hypothetical protein ABPG75_003674 [Micractinium tetrahymenae]